MVVGYGRTLPPGHLPAFSVNTEEEARALITLCCPKDAAGRHYARELAAEQTIENLHLFGDRLARGYEFILRRGRDKGMGDEDAAEAVVAKARAEREERRGLGSTAKKGFRGRNYMQTTCIWCGNHRQVTRCGSVCQKVSPSVRSALMRFAREYGRTWRSVLKKSWESACADVADPAWRALLQEARNVIGPRRLHKVEFTNL